MESHMINKARAFAENVFKDRSFDNRPFHNLSHTRDVVDAVEEIGSHIELTDDEMESALIAAWLHDIGYLEGEGDHEIKSANKSRELLQEWGASQKKMTEVADAILSTKIPQQPKSLVGKVVCDADLYHLSTEYCKDKSGKLREEWETQGKKSMSDAQWLQYNLDFLEGHRYHTAYGQTILQAGKKRNIKTIRKQITPEV